MASQYLPHIIYSMAITSLSIHLITQRKNAEAELAQVAAQISILESVAAQLRSSEPLSAQELERLRKLGRPPAEEVDAKKLAAATRWRDVFFGKKGQQKVAGTENEWDLKDLESLRKELEK